MTTPCPRPDAARSLRDAHRRGGGGRERDAHPDGPRSVEALWDSGLMQLFNPAEAGGAEPSFAEMIETWIELAWQDGSLGWVGIANFPSAAACAAYLPDAGFDEVFTAHDNRVTVGGQFFPNGMGASVDGGYRDHRGVELRLRHRARRVRGRRVHADAWTASWWSATTGCRRCWWPSSPARRSCSPTGGTSRASRAPAATTTTSPTSSCPRRRTFELFTRTPERGRSAAFRMGLMAITAAGHASWALGVAKSMLDDVGELAVTKVRMGDDGALANRSTFQKGLSHHSAMWKAARLLVLDTFTRAERHVQDGGDLTPSMRADLRVAATYATEASREVVQWAHLAAGTSAIREGSRLERAFRDLYTGSQHVFIGEKTYTDAARIHLGLVEDQFGL